MAAGRKCTTAIIVLLHFVAYANGVSLDILPSGEIQTKAIGSSIILTCKPDVDDVKLITDMQWLNPKNQVIESLSTFSGTSKPAMYTEMHQGNSLSLFFNSLQEEQAGNYTCRANYANTVALSKSVMIETIIAITWDDAQSNQYPILGEDFAIRCKVRAKPSPLVDWLYNGELIRTNDHYITEAHALKIKNVQESDDGIYTCRASVLTTGELQERAIRVEVLERPIIEELETPVEIIEGENANIVCKAKGKPPPKFTWVKSLTQQDLAKADRFRVEEDTGVLTITGVNRDDAGEYQCTAKNAADTANTNIMVNVIVKPKIMEFTNKTVVLGKEVNITCKAFGRPPPMVTFRKHTSDERFVIGAQPDDDRIVLIKQVDDVSGETVGILTIHDVLRSNDGLYECIAQNKGGDAFKNGHLMVEFPPSFAAMHNHTVWSWEERPVNLTCIAESIPNATIRWTMNGDQRIDDNTMIRQIGKGPVSVLEVVPLDRRYYASYKCIASNIHGTREHVIELRQATKPKELLQAKIVDTTATTVKFNLVPPPTEEELPIRTITVQYREQGQTWSNSRNKTWAVDSLYVVEGLKPQTTYDFRFSARNEVGFGNWGTNIQETTSSRTVPGEPKLLSKPADGSQYDTSRYNNQYELRWLVPVDNGEPIDRYEIKYCKLRRVSGDWIVLEDTCTTQKILSQMRSSHYLKDLTADTFYTVEITAHNAMGYSTAGSMRFKTARGHTKVVHHEGLSISSTAIIGIVITILLIVVVIVDAICCCTQKTGIIFYVCERSRRKPVDEEDAKLGRDEKEPLKEEKKITPIIDSGLRRETSITFDGKRSVSKTGFVGKDSAV